MAHQTDPTPHIPHLHIDTASIAARLTILAEAGHCPRCGLSLFEVVADSADLLVEVARLYAALLATRRESANRLAAILATLRAESDDEADPLGFLRDELAESPGGSLSPEDRGWCW